jgi:RNA polymerase sigma-70 factor, ECF subfamily
MKIGPRSTHLVEVNLVRSSHARSPADEGANVGLRLVEGGQSVPADVDVGGERGAPFRADDAMGTHDERFAAIYEAWFEDVVKWIGALGMPDSEAEDLAQEVFLVVNRKLSRFDGRNQAGWLYRITVLTVRDHRRRAWFRNLFRRRQQNVDIEAVARVDGIPTLAREEEQDRLALQRILAQMRPKLRATFVLFEIEGRSGDEIAAIQNIPRATVWTRLHNARRVFWKLVDELRRQEGETK